MSASDTERDAEASPNVLACLSREDLESTLAAIVRAAGARTEDAILAEVDWRDKEKWMPFFRSTEICLHI